jgi:GMP synthase-like glutamine amidotransferase
MGIRHTKVRMEGVQFHPESIKTDDGMTMLKNFVSWTTGTWSEEELQVIIVSLFLYCFFFDIY